MASVGVASLPMTTLPVRIRISSGRISRNQSVWPEEETEEIGEEVVGDLETAVEVLEGLGRL
jgi:hypothetical protein